MGEAIWRDLPYPNDYARARPYFERFGGPTYLYVNARTHHIDAVLVQAISQGAIQVVNPGAGFDSRAYRFGGRYPHVRFFELDLPAMIRAKRERVVRILGAVPDRVTLVATDFNTRPLEDVLCDAGDDRTQRTFFI